jgi:drug/metabolite transporter (DMT)-like permease
VLGAVAPGLFVLLWSTGFVGAKYGLPYAEPFTFLFIRLSVAAALLGAAATLLGSGWPASRRAFGHAAVAGLLLHAGYLGGVFFGIDRGVPAGVAAVIVSLQPVLAAALAAALLGERVIRRQWLGLAVGLVGVSMVVSPGLLATGADPASMSLLGVAGCLAALAAGTGGTLYQKQHGDRVPLLAGTAIQYAAASGVLLAAALLTEDMVIRWTSEFMAAMAWLVIVLSLGAVLLMLTLLRHGTATRVSTLLYLVPPATAVEALLLFGETLDRVQLVGLVVAVVGVALVTIRISVEPSAEPRP